MSSAKIKLAIITEIMSPYRTPVFNEIAQEGSVDLEVFYLAETSGGRKWKIEKEKMGYAYTLVPGLSIPLPDRFPVFFNPGLFKKLLEKKPDIVVCGGYHHPSFLLAFAYAKIFRKKLGLWCESHDRSVRVRNFPAEVYRKFFIEASDGFIVPGEASESFLRKFKLGNKPVYRAGNVVDNSFFAEGAARFRKEKEQLKKKLQLPAKNILYVGRWVDSKGILTLLQAFKQMKTQEVGLILVGDGQDEQKYRDYCRFHSVTNVFFKGFCQQEELPLYYALADLFVLPSFHDEWGLVLNEAMASGLPVIASDRAGAAYDLVRAENGFIFSAGNGRELQQKIEEVFSDEKRRIAMGQASSKIIQEFSPSSCAREFLRVAQELSRGAYSEIEHAKV